MTSYLLDDGTRDIQNDGAGSNQLAYQTTGDFSDPPTEAVIVDKNYVDNQAGGASIDIEEDDGTPSVSNADTLKFPNGTLVNPSSGVAEYQGPNIELVGTAQGNFGTIDFANGTSTNSQISTSGDTATVAYNINIGGDTENILFQASDGSIGTDSNFNFNGSQVTIDGTGVIYTGNRTDATGNAPIVTWRANWNGDNVAQIQMETGTDTSNTDDGVIKLETQPGGGTGMVTRMEIAANGDFDMQNEDIFNIGKLVVGTTEANEAAAGEENLEIHAPIPTVRLIDTDDNPDFRIEVNNGEYRVIPSDTSVGFRVDTSTSSFNIRTNDLVAVNSAEFENKEQSFTSTNGILFWDKSVGMYVKSENAPNESSTGNPRAIWSSGNVTDGTDISVSTDTEDRPTINHADTSSQGNVDTSGDTIIDSISLDGRGHVTDITTRTKSSTSMTWDLIDDDGTSVTVTDGDSVTLNTDATLNTDFSDTGSPSFTMGISHATSGGSDISGGSGVVVESVTIDASGHVTATGSVDLDSRYVEDGGDTMTGALGLPDGSISSPAIFFSNDTNSGFFRNNGGFPTIVDDGVKVAEFQQGDSNPQLLVRTTSSPFIRVEDNTNNVKLDLASTDSVALVGTQTNHNLDIMSNNTVRVVVHGGGRTDFQGNPITNMDFIGLGERTSNPTSNGGRGRLYVFDTGSGQELRIVWEGGTQTTIASE